MRPELLALAVPLALAIRHVTRRRPPVRTDAAEVLRWWGLARGMNDSRHPGVDLAAVPEEGFDPLDVALSRQALRPADESEALSAAVPSHAITLQGSALFHTGDRQRVHAAVEGKLDDDVQGTVLLVTCEKRDDDTKDWLWLCDLTVVAMEGVTPRGPGLLLRRRASGGGARVALPEGYTPLALESVELDQLYDVRIAAGCDEVAGARRAHTGHDRLVVRARPRGARGRDRGSERAPRDGVDARQRRGARCLRRGCLLAGAGVHRRHACARNKPRPNPCGRS